jgi:cytochrome c-type biogenesis protein
MGGGEALWAGFSSFFSIWQVCILQISPFFMAYIVSLYLIHKQKGDAHIGKWVVIPFIAYMLGFTLFYSLLISSGLGIGRTLAYNTSNLRFVSGIVILVISLYILLVDRISLLEKTRHYILLSTLSLLIGITFAIIYSPCITPTLSEIMGMAVRPQTASAGFVLALFYGLGLSLAFGVTGIGLILLLKKTRLVLENIRLAKDVCGIIVLVPGMLNITGYMTHYKAFFLGLLV